MSSTPRDRSRPPAPDQAVTQAWTAAVAYARLLASGGRLPPRFVNGLLMQGDETGSFETTAIYERWWGGDGTYTHSSTFVFGSPTFVAAGLVGNALGNRSRRNRAARDMVPTWRERQTAPVTATTKRLLCHSQLKGWLSFWYGGMQELYPEPEKWSLTMVWPGAAPLRLSGLSAPYLAVHVAAQVMPQTWTHHPAIAPLLRVQDAP